MTYQPSAKIILEVFFPLSNDEIQSPVDPWRMQGLGAPTAFAVENLSVTLQSAFGIWSSTSMDSTNRRMCNTVVDIGEKTKQKTCIMDPCNSNTCCLCINCVSKKQIFLIEEHGFCSKTWVRIIFLPYNNPMIGAMI